MKLLLSFIFCILWSWGLFSQNEINESEKNIRLSLRAANQDYIELEKTWQEEGKHFPALVEYSDNGTEFIFIFESLRHPSMEMKPKIESRLLSVFPQITFLDMNNHPIVVRFLNTTSPEVINNFFQTQGYVGYEVFNN